jgi:hypothetical protein
MLVVRFGWLIVVNMIMYMHTVVLLCKLKNEHVLSREQEPGITMFYIKRTSSCSISAHHFWLDQNFVEGVMYLNGSSGT